MDHSVILATLSAQSTADLNRLIARDFIVDGALSSCCSVGAPERRKKRKPVSALVVSRECHLLSVRWALSVQRLPLGLLLVRARRPVYLESVVFLSVHQLAALPDQLPELERCQSAISDFHILVAAGVSHDDSLSVENYINGKAERTAE